MEIYAINGSFTFCYLYDVRLHTVAENGNFVGITSEYLTKTKMGLLRCENSLMVCLAVWHSAQVQ